MHYCEYFKKNKNAKKEVDDNLTLHEQNGLNTFQVSKTKIEESVHSAMAYE